jgi:D-lactate dehydrogenase (cytochrome)
MQGVSGHDLPAGIPTMRDPVEMLAYEADAGLESGRADAVAVCATAEDVARLCAWSAAAGVPLIARGAGTGTSGGAVAVAGGVIAVLAGLNRIVEIDVDAQTAVVEPGVVNAALDEAARRHGLFYPPDPASGRTCTLGGNIAENAGGPRCCKYGVTSNYVLALTAVLADGRIVRFGGPVADPPEYDWVGVLTGSEGTLALITQARLRLLRRPEASNVLMAGFATVDAASEAVAALSLAGLAPATIEMLDQVSIDVVERSIHLGLPTDAEALLIIEVDGYRPGVPRQLAQISTVLRAVGTTELRVAGSDAEAAAIWSARKGVAGALTLLAPANYPSDCTVPRSQIGRALREITRICAADHLRVTYLLHAGDGNLHPSILIDDPDDPALLRRVIAAEAQALEVCLRLGGSITGEHGVGSERRHFMPLMYNAAELAAMHDVKAVFDPAGLLNPGKIFPEGADDVPAPGLPALRASGGAPPAATIEAPPSAVASATAVTPATVAEAAEIIRSCAAGTSPRSVRVVGGGTKSRLLPPTDVTLLTRGLDGIRTYGRADLYVAAGAGTRLDELQAELSRDRLWVPLVSPWPAATVGGIASVACNAPLRMRYAYGCIRDVVLAVEAVLPDSRVVRLGRPVVKNVAGYDLPKLFVGSHGTLGLLTELTLRLTPQPPTRSSLVVPVTAVAQAADWAGRLRRLSLVASALLVVPGTQVDIGGAPLALVYTAEGVAEDVDAELTAARDILEAAGAVGTARRDDVDGSALWAAFLAQSSPAPVPQAPSWLLRAGFPPASLQRLLPGVAAALAPAAWLADFGNSLLYARAGGLDEAAALRLAARAAGGYAVLLDGHTHALDAVVAHGAVAFDRWGYTPESLDLMAGLKARWDPAGLFNPGAFLV